MKAEPQAPRLPGGGTRSGRTTPRIRGAVLWKFCPARSATAQDPASCGRGAPTPHCGSKRGEGTPPTLISVLPFPRQIANEPYRPEQAQALPFRAFGFSRGSCVSWAKRLKRQVEDLTHRGHRAAVTGFGLKVLEWFGVRRLEFGVGPHSDVGRGKFDVGCLRSVLSGIWTFEIWDFRK